MNNRLALRYSIYALAWLLAFIPAPFVDAAPAVMVRFHANYSLGTINQEVNDVESNDSVPARLDVKVTDHLGQCVEEEHVEWTVEDTSGGSGAEQVRIRASPTDAQGVSHAQLFSPVAESFVVKASCQDQTATSSVRFVKSTPLSFVNKAMDVSCSSNPGKMPGQEVTGGNSGELTYSSDNPYVAIFENETVNELTVKKPGKAVITATEHKKPHFSSQSASYLLAVSPGTTKSTARSPVSTTDFWIECPKTVSLGTYTVKIHGPKNTPITYEIDSTGEKSETLSQNDGTFEFDLDVLSPDKIIKIKAQNTKSQETTEKEIIVRPYTMYAEPFISEEGVWGAKIKADKLEGTNPACPANWTDSIDGDGKCETQVMMNSGKYGDIKVTDEYTASPTPQKVVVAETKIECIDMSDILSNKGPICGKIKINNIVHIPVQDYADLQLSLYWPEEDQDQTKINSLYQTPLFSEEEHEIKCGAHLSDIMNTVVKTSNDRLMHWEALQFVATCQVPCLDKIVQHAFEVLSGWINEDEETTLKSHKKTNEKSADPALGWTSKMSSPAIQKKKSGAAVDSEAKSSPPFSLSSFRITKKMTKEHSSDPEGFLFATENTSAKQICCGKFYGHISFFVDDLGKIKKFALKKIHFDDYLDIFVNGFLVLRAGSDLMFHKKLTERFTCERNRINVHDGIDLDLKPYLKEGFNIIQLSNLIGGGGFSEIIVQADPLSSIDPDK